MSTIPPPESVTLQAKVQSHDYSKVLKSWELAASDGYEWLWIDTVCIDKKSSSELSEAINSMFRWYGNADVCYAYLRDVPASLKGNDWPDALRLSRWWSRGLNSSGAPCSIATHLRRRRLAARWGQGLALVSYFRHHRYPACMPDGTIMHYERVCRNANVMGPKQDDESERGYRVLLAWNI